MKREVSTLTRELQNPSTAEIRVAFYHGFQWFRVAVMMPALCDIPFIS